MDGFIVSTEWDGRPRKMYKFVCPVCGNDYYAPVKKGKPAKVTCSKACRGVRQRNQIEVSCFMCGKIFFKAKFKASLPKSGKHFCTRSCKEEAQHIYGKSLGDIPYAYGTGKSTYRACVQVDSVCNRCGFSDVRILEVHHRDRDRNNNHPDNLEVLCPNCHALDHFLNKDGKYSWLS